MTVGQPHYRNTERQISEQTRELSHEEKDRLRAGPNPHPKEGAFADIIIVNGDPTKDIRLLMDADKNIDLIMKDGKIYKNTI